MNNCALHADTLWSLAPFKQSREIGETRIRFGPREAGDGEMRQGATGRRQEDDRVAT